MRILLNLAGMYLVILGVCVLAGMVYEAQWNLALWHEQARFGVLTASMVISILIFMCLGARED